MADFRVYTSFFSHLKTLKLKRKLGASGAYTLLSLWAYATENKPKGILSGMTSEDIEAVAQWDGEDGALVGCLQKIGFLDQLDGGVFSLHNWEDRNAWAFHSDERSEAAKKAATARWSKQRKDAPRIAPEDKGQCPSPSPSPSPSPNHKNTCAKTCAPEPGFALFWKAYPKKKSKAAAERTWARKRLGNGSFDLVMDGLKRAKVSSEWTKDSGQYIPYPATWLNNRGWEDELPEQSAPVDYLADVLNA